MTVAANKKTYYSLLLCKLSERLPPLQLKPVIYTGLLIFQLKYKKLEVKKISMK